MKSSLSSVNIILEVVEGSLSKVHSIPKLERASRQTNLLASVQVGLVVLIDAFCQTNVDNLAGFPFEVSSVYSTLISHLFKGSDLLSIA